MDSAQRYIESCPIGCAAPLATTDIVLPEGPLLRCPECRQLVSQVTAARYWETMARFDLSDFNQPEGRELTRRFELARRRLRRIAALLDRKPEKIRLLDVGCSRGHFIEAAVDSGFRAEGVEPAPQIAAAARERGLTVRTGLLEDQCFPAESFDAITLFEVIEHLKDPALLLAECRRILKAGGVLVLSTGNAASWTARTMKARWDYFHIAQDAGHVSFYNPASLQRLATRCGYAVERITTARVRFVDKGNIPPPLYLLAKVAAELLNIPAHLAGMGHDMLAFLRKT
ncbi:MAG TPA: class I SAM-dependent methyltransferase [Burkholderiales bacterium]|nr:class I SAM-dependent methyltransferase [Burkholderiales bacterium]